MIVDLNVGGWDVLVVGAGSEARRRAAALAGEGCRVTVVGDEISDEMRALAGACGRITLVRGRLSDADMVAGSGARLVIAATDDAQLNAAVVGAARRLPACIAYSADDPAASDYAHLAAVDLGHGVRAAVSTGGRSPAVAARLRERAGAALEGLVTREDTAMMDLQEDMRAEARSRLRTHAERRDFLRALMDDALIAQSIKGGRMREARERAMGILEGRKNG